MILLGINGYTQTPFYPDQSSHITYIQHPQPNNNFVPQPSFNTKYLQHPMENPEDISNPTTALDMALEFMSKAFQLNNTTPKNNNQRSSSNPSNIHIAQPGMNMDQDRQMLMVDDNVWNQFRENAVQNVGHLYGIGNVKTAPAEGNGNGINGNPIRCYNCQGENHLACNCTVKPGKQDAAYLQKQMQISQKEEAGIQLTQEEFDFMADAYESAELSKEKSTVSSLLEEKKNLKSDFKICEDELFDKQIQLKNMIKELDNILVKTGQSIQTMHVLSPKPDSFYHTEQKMALGYQNPFYLKQAQQMQHSLYNGKVLLEKHDPSIVYDSEETMQLAQESPKFVRDFQSLAKEADESLAKHKAMELEIERLLRAVASQDIMAIVQNNFVVDTSNLQTELELTRAQTKAIIDSFQDKLLDTMYENAKLRAQLFDKVSERKKTNKGTSANTQFSKQSILGKPPSSSKPKPLFCHSFSKILGSSQGIFRINPFKAPRVDNFVPNKHVKASVRTKPIIVLQPHVITKKDVNSKRSCFSPKDVESTTRTRIPDKQQV
ncbi:hypothetical protein Tco_1491734 [Tanacetum coccineum]